jgi:AraC-like DNA-binding protein
MGLVHMTEQLHEGAAAEAEVFMTGPAPSYYARLAAFLPAPVRYDAPACFVRFPTSLLAQRPWLADPAIAALAREQCEAEFEKLFPDAAPIASEVRRRVAAAPEGTPTLEAIARTLGLSSRTLRRRLEQEGVSYRDIVEAALRERCERLLAETDLQVSEVAFRAGYNDVSNFTRAFRRWTGKTPKAYRRDARASR